MKYRIVAAVLIAAFLFFLPAHAMAGNGGDKEGNSPDDTFNWQDFLPDPQEEPPLPSPSPSPSPIPESPPPEPPSNNPWISDPFTPPGTGTVIDNATDADGTEFFTIQTPNGNIFHLIIDRRSNQQNVHFLNTVPERDLLALAAQSGDMDFPPWPTPEMPVAPLPPEEPVEEPEPEPEPEPQGGGLGLGPVLIVVLLGGAGAGWYFKIYRPKQQGAATVEDDFDYGDEADDYEEDAEDNPATWEGEDDED